MRTGKLFVVLTSLMVFLNLHSGSLFAQQVVAPGSDRYVLPYDESRGVVSYADYLDQSLKSVVRIYNGQYDEKKALKFPGHGSGVIYDARKGLIMTNQHVVDKYDVLYVELFDGELVEGELVGADPSSDIAVVRAARPLIHQSVFVDTNTLRVGDLVFAVGYPERYDKAVSSGIISGLNRRGFYNKIGDIKIEDYIQTDTAINPGNSGGPLFDSRGRIVGINTWIHRDSDGLGFSVPSNVAVTVARRIVGGRLTEPGWFGATVDSLYPNDAKKHGLKTLRGAIVLNVDENSPAMIAGLRKNDIITGAGGREIADKYQFVNFILLSDMGVPYTVYYLRDQVPKKTKIVLTDRDGRVPSRTPASDSDSDSVGTQQKPQTTQVQKPDSFYGATVTNHSQRGAEISAISAESEAFGKGLKVGDIVLSVNSSPISNVEGLFSSIKALNGRTAVLRIQRGNSTFNLIF